MCMYMCTHTYLRRWCDRWITGVPCRGIGLKVLRFPEIPEFVGARESQRGGSERSGEKEGGATYMCMCRY